MATKSRYGLLVIAGGAVVGWALLWWLIGWWALLVLLGGAAMERVELGARYAARLEGKSSLGRLGLLVHSTAGFVDPGFRGRITLELSNVSQLPVKLWPGMTKEELDELIRWWMTTSL